MHPQKKSGAQGKKTLCITEYAQGLWIHLQKPLQTIGCPKCVASDICSLRTELHFAPHWWNALCGQSLVVAVATKEAQEHEEEVDKVEIQGEGTEDGTAADGNGVVKRSTGTELAQLVGIVGGKAGKHDNAHHADHKVHHAAAKEDIDNGSNDDADETHEQEVAHAGKVTLSHCSVDGHRKEHACCRDEGIGNGANGVDNKDGRECQACQHGVEHEHARCHGGRHFVHCCRKSNHNAELSHDQGNHDNEIAEDHLLQGRASGNGQSHNGSDAETCGHPCVHVAHVHGSHTESSGLKGARGLH